MLDLQATEAAFASAVAAITTSRDVVVVTGPDATEYLHGQLSQDVTSLAVGSSAPTLLLQPQGKIDALLRMSRPAEAEIWLDVEHGHGAAALARLERFKLRVDADLRLETWPMIALRGPGADGFDPGPALGTGGAALDPHWPGVVGVDLLGPEVGVPGGVPEGDPAALEVQRISVGVAAMGTELTPDTIPAAAGVVEDAVDFTKGCYVGQELVARIDSRGSNTPTSLHRVRFVDVGLSWPADGTGAVEVERDGVQIGTVTSSAVTADGRTVALAYLKRGVDVPGRAEAVVGERRHPVELLPLR